MRAPIIRLHTDELFVDSFAGGGGASLGIEMATGRSPDIAINHDEEAIALHAANHPTTRHYREDVWKVSPVKATGGRRVALMWLSPDCKHFSKAKGGKPVEKKIRGLAWVAVRWARSPVKPRVMILENVEEFQDWGPLLDNNLPDPTRRGFTFRRWLGALRAAGYEVEVRELSAHHYGAPTSRKRLFVIARCDGLPIVWPEPTHGPGLEPFRIAGECVDFSIPCPSIFERTKPLAEKTLARIARGVQRFVLENPRPFIVPLTHGGGESRVYDSAEPMRTITGANRGEFALAGATLIQTSWGERPGQAPRVPHLDKPLGTVMAGGIKHAVVAAFLAKHYSARPGGGFNGGGSLERPFGTVTTRDHHALVTVEGSGSRHDDVRAFLLKYYGTGGGASLAAPMHTVTTKDRFALVTVAGEEYAVADIGMRMLVPRELYRAQGFPDSYQIEIEHNGRPLSKTAQVKMCGNSVCPPLACALVDANLGAVAVKRPRGQLVLL